MKDSPSKTSETGLDKTDTVQQESDPHKQCHEDVEISSRSNYEKTKIGKDNEEKNDETKEDLKKRKADRGSDCRLMEGETS